MWILLCLAWKSLKSRWLTALLSISAIALSVFLLLGVEKVRQSAEESFSGALSQTDLVVGARGSDLQLILYTVFHMGEAVQNISYESYEYFQNHPAVEWAIPISLGDSHRGFRVVATNGNFYKHYRFRGEGKIDFLEGRSPRGLFEVVIGSEIAKKLNYRLGQKIVISHGLSAMSLTDHKENPFTVVGILKNTGTPVDKALYIELESMEALHMNWQSGAFQASASSSEIVQKENIKVRQVTSFLLRTKNRIALLGLQRELLGLDLMSVIPGVALSRMWQTLGYADKALRFVAGCVALVALMGLCLILLSSLQERKREMSILRALGLGPVSLVFLQSLESFLICLVGILSGLTGIYLACILGRSWLLENFSIDLSWQMLNRTELSYLGLMLLTSQLLSLGPALWAYRKSAGEGIAPRGF